MRAFLVLLAVAIALTGEIIDRVAIAIGNRTITETQIDEELRITALLNHKPLVRNQKARRDAADRLVQQFLIRGEMRVSRYPDPDSTELRDYRDQVAKDFGGAARLNDQIAQYGLDKETFKRHLDLQLATLRFIQARFSQEVSVSDTDLQAFIHDEPTQTDVSSARRQLVETRTDEALATWLEEARKQFNIVYLDKTLQ
jgi:hypothetical protein